MTAVGVIEEQRRRTRAEQVKPAVRPQTSAVERALIADLIGSKFSDDPEFGRITHRVGGEGDLVDMLFLSQGDAPQVEGVFERLRWGGQFVYVSRNAKDVADKARRFAQSGAFVIESAPARRVKRLWGMMPFGRRYHYFVARKILLIKPGESTERFTYHVQLARPADVGLAGSGYVVLKEVPTLDRVLSRLREKFPDADLETLTRRARKFTDKIFPVFLTREAAILKLLQRDLPRKFAERVPHLIHTEQDSQGFVRKLYMNWLRNAVPRGGPLTQVQFARQSAELLAAIHDTARIIHLDLRLDNFVITERGVGFVDFGSAVRVGETFNETSLLSSLFEEMMRTSQIQKMLGKMQDAGTVTSQEIRNSYQRIDKAMDFFYLAVQINAPHANEDFKGLVKHDPISEEAKAVGELTEQILRPAVPEDPPFKSAQDILHGIAEVERKLGIK